VAAPRTRAVQAIADPAVWVEVAAAGAGAAVAEAADAGVDRTKEQTMQTKILPSGLAVFFVAALLIVFASGATPAPGQETFATPRQAGRALLSAAEADDMGTLSKIFGPEADEILNSGDAVADKASRANFVEKAKRLMVERIDANDPNQGTLLIGADRFPFPIPLARSAGRWYFDTKKGKTEILVRRIGSNELDAIAACKAYVDAQYDYASEDRNKNGVPEYARKLISSSGKRDGLFWPGADAPPTQLAADVKRAQAEGYRKEDDAPTPYHGYYFRILTAQGPSAKTGVQEYVVHDLMIGGFALVAWPAEYGVSGVKTFLVNHDGVIYEKDLGASTSSLVEKMTAFNPDAAWRQVR
jgi:hypothetical protein